MVTRSHHENWGTEKVWTTARQKDKDRKLKKGHRVKTPRLEPGWAGSGPAVWLYL